MSLDLYIQQFGILNPDVKPLNLLREQSYNTNEVPYLLTLFPNPNPSPSQRRGTDLGIFSSRVMIL